MASPWNREGGSPNRETNFSISRGELNELLISEAERAGARFSFGHRFAAADLCGGRLEFENEETGETVHVEPHRIFGALRCAAL